MNAGALLLLVVLLPPVVEVVWDVEEVAVVWVAELLVGRVMPSSCGGIFSLPRSSPPLAFFSSSSLMSRQPVEWCIALVASSSAVST